MHPMWLRGSRGALIGDTANRSRRRWGARRARIWPRRICRVRAYTDQNCAPDRMRERCRRRRPRVMKRVVVDHFGGPEVLRVVEDEDPRPAGGEVLVSVLAAGVSF